LIVKEIKFIRSPEIRIVQAITYISKKWYLPYLPLKKCSIRDSIVLTPNNNSNMKNLFLTLTIYSLHACSIPEINNNRASLLTILKQSTNNTHFPTLKIQKKDVVWKLSKKGFIEITKNPSSSQVLNDKIKHDYTLDYKIRYDKNEFSYKNYNLTNHRKTNHYWFKLNIQVSKSPK
jgi:hypothetical protein